jgi:hypothetical protein
VGAPVREGEAVHYGDVFEWIDGMGRAVSLVMFIGPVRYDPDKVMWVGVQMFDGRTDEVGTFQSLYTDSVYGHWERVE